MAGLTYNMIDATDLATSEVYGRVLCELGEQHAEIVGLSGDLAKSTKIGVFAAQFPQRFFNVGIAEQNLFAMAAGLASTGLVPFVSTFAAFATMRAGEQLRTDICYGCEHRDCATARGLTLAYDRPCGCPRVDVSALGGGVHQAAGRVGSDLIGA